MSFKLADMITEIDAADWLTLASAWRLDQGLPANREIASAKLYASEMLARVTDEAIQVYGGMGLMDDLPLARFWRDARVERIWDGTSEIQRHIISRDLLRPLGGWSNRNLIAKLLLPAQKKHSNPTEFFLQRRNLLRPVEDLQSG